MRGFPHWHDRLHAKATAGDPCSQHNSSDQAVARLTAHHYYRDAEIIFITPDNCIEQLRHQALLDGKRVLCTTYSIKRGFWLLDPNHIRPERYLYAATLDGMEREGTPFLLSEIASKLGRIDFLVTGTGAINEEGVRFGKGHGFFDAEWAMLFKMKTVTATTPVAAVVHDCQLLQEKLYPEIFDTVADVVFTPTRTLEVSDPHKPECGIVWDLLDPHMLATIPPLQELKEIEGV